MREEGVLTDNRLLITVHCLLITDFLLRSLLATTFKPVCRQTGTEYPSLFDFVEPGGIDIFDFRIAGCRDRRHSGNGWADTLP